MTELSVTRGEVELRPGDPLAFFSVEARPAEPPPRDLLLVLDAAGSLAGPPRTRAAAALRTLVSSLADDRRVGLVLAASAATVVAPVAPLARSRGAIDRALDRCPAGGRTTVARACELAALEIDRAARPATVVVVSDLAWGAGEVEAAGRLEAKGAQLVLVQATSAFTPATPARPARLELPLPLSPDDPAPLELARALGDLVQAGAPPAAPGWLEVTLANAPVAWFAGDPLEPCAPGAAATARVALELGRARLAFATRDRGDVPGEARLVVEGAAPRVVSISRGQASALERAPELALTGASGA